MSPFTLLSLDEPVRRKSVSGWARELLQDLEEGAVTPRALAVIFNQLALMEVLVGRPDWARATCEAEISWLETVAPREEAWALSLQPEINLARLDRVERPLHEVLATFDLPSRIGHRGDSEVQRFAWSVWIADSLKTLVHRGEWERALELLDRQQEEAPGEFSGIITEARLATLTTSGRAVQAIDLASSASTDSIARLAAHLTWQAYAMTSLNASEAVRVSWRVLALLSIETAAEAIPDGVRLKVLLALTELGVTAANDRLRDAAGRCGLAFARACGDELAQVLFLQHLESSSAEAATSFRELLRTSHYAVARQLASRRGLGPAVAIPVELAALRQHCSRWLGSTALGCGHASS